jgi:hypothetical protein
MPGMRGQEIEVVFRGAGLVKRVRRKYYLY